MRDSLSSCGCWEAEPEDDEAAKALATVHCFIGVVVWVVMAVVAIVVVIVAVTARAGTRATSCAIAGGRES